MQSHGWTLAKKNLYHPCFAARWKFSKVNVNLKSFLAQKFKSKWVEPQATIDNNIEFKNHNLFVHFLWNFQNMFALTGEFCHSQRKSLQSNISTSKSKSKFVIFQGTNIFILIFSRCSKVSFWDLLCWRLPWHGKLSWMIGKTLNLVILVKFPTLEDLETTH